MVRHKKKSPMIVYKQNNINIMLSILRRRTSGQYTYENEIFYNIITCSRSSNAPERYHNMTPHVFHFEINIIHQHLAYTQSLSQTELNKLVTTEYYLNYINLQSQSVFFSVLKLKHVILFYYKVLHCCSQTRKMQQFLCRTRFIIYSWYTMYSVLLYTCQIRFDQP